MWSVTFIRGFKIGIEYTDLDEHDNEYMDTEEFTFLSSLDLGFFRIVWWS